MKRKWLKASDVQLLMDRVVWRPNDQICFEPAAEGYCARMNVRDHVGDAASRLRDDRCCHGKGLIYPLGSGKRRSISVSGPEPLWFRLEVLRDLRRRAVVRPLVMRVRKVGEE